MKNSRFTIGILGFLVFVFCVDTAISDAQIFRRRLCNPGWRQQQCCTPVYINQCCPQDPCDQVCQPFGTPACGTCKIEWDGVNNIWKMKSACDVDPTCSCMAPKVTTNPGETTCECEDSSITGPKADMFYLVLDGSKVCVDAAGIDSEFSFEIWEHNGTTYVLKSTVEAEYDTNVNPVNRMRPKPLPDPYDVTTTHYVYLNGSPFYLTQFWVAGETHTNKFGQWVVTITMH